MIKKLLWIGLGVLLVSSSFFAGIAYKQLSDKNRPPKNNTFLSECPIVNQNIPNCLPDNNAKKTLDDIILTQNPYSLGEERSVPNLGQELENVSLYLLGEMKQIRDNRSGLFYAFYRAGQSDSPPYYSAGRVLVRVWAATPPSVGGLFDTEITDVEPFGIVELAKNADGIILNCAKQSPINVTDCKYSIAFDKEGESLVVKKIK